MKVHDASARAAIVRLVHRKEHGLVGRTNDARDFLVARYEAFAAINNKHKEIGVPDGAPPPLEHEFVQRVLAGTEHTARVGEFEARALPFRFVGNDVTSCPGDRRDNRPPRARQPIEKRRFPNIRTSDQYDGRQTLHQITFRLEAEATKHRAQFPSSDGRIIDLTA
jgi:hypothetical protein